MGKLERNLLAGLLAGLLVLSAAACSGDEERSDAPVVQLGGPNESNRTLSPDEIDRLGDTPSHTDADVAFTRNMILHHEQALVMTAFVPDRAVSRGLPLLAARMEISQRDEIAQLEQWLAARGEGMPSGEHHHGAHDDVAMPGMLTDAELARLGAAEGRRFDRLFLRFMIGHHEGAVLMVQQLLGAGGGQEPALFQLAQHIDADQRAEISRMRSLLADE